MLESKDKKAFQKGANKKFQNTAWFLLFTIIFLSFYFIYLLFRINPKLIYQSQEPVFFLDKYFINEFFSYPGGVNELISSFLSQFFYYSWTGSLLLVLVFVLVAWNTKLLVKSIRPNAPILYLHWLPSLFLLALHSNYRFPLILTLGLLWALLGVNIYVRLAPSNNNLRFLFYIIIHAMLYYITGGQVFIFSIIIILYDVLYHRRILLPLLYIIFAGLLPYVGASTLFVLHIQDAYVKHLTSYNTYRLTWLSWALYAFFLLVLLLVSFEKKYVRNSQKRTNNLFGRLLSSRSVPIRLIQGVFFLVLIIIAARYSYDKNGKAFLMIDCYAQSEEWEKVFDIAQKGLPISNIVQCQVNRALYHTGNLCEEMFSMTQLFGSDGLFMVESMRAQFALQHSDVFFDLGLINESEHWAYEAITANGDTAWNLQRLVLIYLMEEKREIAEKYLTMLQKTIWHKNWATEYKKYLADSNDFWANTKFRYLKSTMPVSDFLVSPAEPELCLEELLGNTKNKMAFEYFMAYCLLEGQIGSFIKHIHRLNYFDYPKIPRHFEEAILIYNQLTGGKGIALPGKKISEETIRKFNDFNAIKAKHKNNKEAARRELNKYRDTYWYYGLYYYKPRG
ncbi:MAG: DUF6057 family protein [Planctomycetota bacterium]|jgi:hypothetical protein